MDSRRVRAVVRGTVQGVNYRASTRAEAARHGLVGWVRNREDGAVELEAEGTEAALNVLIAWCRKGPRFAEVASVDVEWLLPTGGDKVFRIVF